MSSGCSPVHLLGTASVVPRTLRILSTRSDKKNGLRKQREYVAHQRVSSGPLTVRVIDSGVWLARMPSHSLERWNAIGSRVDAVREGGISRQRLDRLENTIRLGSGGLIRLRRKRRMCRLYAVPVLLTEDSLDACRRASDLRRLDVRSDDGGRPPQERPRSCPRRATEPAGLGESPCPKPSACASDDNMQSCF